jgi:hypothetical protein
MTVTIVVGLALVATFALVSVELEVRSGSEGVAGAAARLEAARRHLSLYKWRKRPAPQKQSPPANTSPVDGGVG